uniref:Uncharacterized protein n=1 Tax=Grammatophora oceanica TaxID=210454 RepID=A0A7S1UUW7_9STRA|mmetsp:Transcript_24624/g.36154  ORF Transcript_24624/g.36154 Transcript_24624/m.36154 type:complete len:114 (+) Transcript_24624:469-810(+)
MMTTTHSSAHSIEESLLNNVFILQARSEAHSRATLADGSKYERVKNISRRSRPYEDTKHRITIGSPKGYREWQLLHFLWDLIKQMQSKRLCAKVGQFLFTDRKNTTYDLSAIL